MRVRVDEIPESGRTLRFHWGEDRLSAFVPPDDPFNLELLRPLNVVLELNRHPDHIRITGKITGTLGVGCHRCLTPFGLPVDEPVDIYLVEKERAPEVEEKELEAEELVYEFFDGEVIDIDQLVAEQVFLTLPVKVLCREDCRGLCPGCGANLNEEACKCKVNSKPSPFDKLKSIRPRLPDAGE